MASLQYLLWLTTRRGIRSDQAAQVLRHFGSAEGAFCADPQEYDLLGLPKEAAESLRDKSMDGAERILAECDRLGVRILTIQDAAYPERLREIPDPPLVLYIRGRLFRFDEELAIGMVGARKCSEYGKRMAVQIARELAQAGVLVVSGMAQGVDAHCLKGALQGGGSVVSVLASGVDVVYPWENRWMYEDVAAAGALISENPPGTKPEGWRFPIRNRIISGLSLGVVAVEAALRSGTLITARRALDQNRDVFAVPGPADAPMSAGTNALIAGGEAKLARSGADILVEYEYRFPGRAGKQARPGSEDAPSKKKAVPAGPPPEPVKEPEPPAGPHAADPAVLAALADQEREVLSCLDGAALTADEIISQTELSARRVNSALTVLQLQGLVNEGPGKRFTAAVRLGADAKTPCETSG